MDDALCNSARQVRKNLIRELCNPGEPELKVLAFDPQGEKYGEKKSSASSSCKYQLEKPTRPPRLARLWVNAA